MNSSKPQPTLKVFAVYNRRAGNVDGGPALEKMLRAGLGDRLIAVAPADDDVAARAEAAGANTVLVAGGDGTISSVARQMVGRDLQLFILPAGTANIIARHLNIPLDLGAALALADDFRLVKLDAVDLNGKLYFSHLSVGVYANASHRAPKGAKKIFRRLAYLREALRQIADRRRWRFDLVLDDKPESLEGSTLMVANVGHFGFSGWKWAEGVRAYDGVLDICVVHARHFRDYLKMLGDLVRFRRPRSPHLTRLTARRRVEISADAPLPIRADGDPAGHLPVRLEFRPASISVMIPADSRP